MSYLLPWRGSESNTLILSIEHILISYLSTHKTNLPFNNLETLLSSTSYKIAVLPGSATADWFRYSSDPLTQRAWIERIEPYLDEFHTYSGIIITILI